MIYFRVLIVCIIPFFKRRICFLIDLEGRSKFQIACTNISDKMTLQRKYANFSTSEINLNDKMFVVCLGLIAEAQFESISQCFKRKVHFLFPSSMRE